MINEKELAERFSLDIDKLILNPAAKITPAGPSPDEYLRHIDLARFMVTAALTSHYRIREKLKRYIMDRVANPGRSNAKALGDGELDDDQLELVAAGTGSEVNYDQQEVFICSRNASTIEGSICPDCGRPKGLHPGG